MIFKVKIGRLIYFLWNYAKSLNARADVETYLYDAARGKKPLPDAAKCRELAIKLGNPNAHTSADSEVPPRRC